MSRHSRRERDASCLREWWDESGRVVEESLSVESRIVLLAVRAHEKILMAVSKTSFRSSNERTRSTVTSQVPYILQKIQTFVRPLKVYWPTCGPAKLILEFDFFTQRFFPHSSRKTIQYDAWQTYLGQKNSLNTAHVLVSPPCLRIWPKLKIQQSGTDIAASNHAWRTRQCSLYVLLEVFCASGETGIIYTWLSIYVYFVAGHRWVYVFLTVKLTNIFGSWLIY